MQMTMQIQGTPVEFTQRVSTRGRHIRVTLYPGGRMVVSAPRHVTWPAIERFLKSKGDWILRKLADVRSQPVPNPAVLRQEYLKHKQTAEMLIKQRVAHFNAIYGFKHGRISIKNHKSLWGSCSRKGNLNFNYKLALLPAAHADYVIVHELCHLAEFNHSPRFWALVAQTIPDHVAIRRELRKIGMTLS